MYLAGSICTDVDSSQRDHMTWHQERLTCNRELRGKPSTHLCYLCPLSRVVHTELVRAAS